MPWRVLLLLVGLLPGAPVAPAAAAHEAAAEEAVGRCRQAASAAERIACLEAALRNELPAESAAATPAVAGPARESAAGEPASEAGPQLQAERPTGPQPDPAPAELLGAEQLQSSGSLEERAARRARAAGLAVAGYRHVPYRRLQVTLENGQVWLQIEGDTQYIRASLRKNQTVDIEESSLGGYRLRLNEMRRTIRVRRVE